ncbi:MAG: MFS transporter [Candidatus Bathyarchaeia archaeon]
MKFISLKSRRKFYANPSSYAYVKMLLLATLFLFIAYIVRFGYGVLLPRIVEDLQLSHMEAGLAFSLYLLMYSMFSVISGRLFDKIGAKVISLLCYIYGIGLMLMGFSNNYYMLALGLVIAGLGSSSSWTPIVALVSGSLPDQWRGRGIGLLEVGIRISHGATGLILPILALTLGWKTCWWIIAILMFIFGFVFQTVVEPRHLTIRRIAKYREVLLAKQFWLIGVSYSLMAFGSYVITTFIVDFLENEVGMPYIEASATVSVMGFMGIVGTLILTWLSDRIGRRKILAMCNAFSSISLLFFFLSPQTAIIKSFLIPITAIYGIFYGALWPTYAACAGDAFSNSVGTVVGLWTLMSGLSALIAPIIGGLTVDITKSYGIALQISCITYALAAVLIILSLKR